MNIGGLPPNQHLLVPLAVTPELVEAIAARVLEMISNVAPVGSPWMTRHAAAEYLSVPLSRLEKDRTVPCRKWDGRVLYRRDEIDAWLEQFRETA